MVRERLSHSPASPGVLGSERAEFDSAAPRSPRARAVTRAAGVGEAPSVPSANQKRSVQARCRHGRHMPVHHRHRAKALYNPPASAFELAARPSSINQAFEPPLRVLLLFFLFLASFLITEPPRWRCLHHRDASQRLFNSLSALKSTHINFGLLRRCRRASLGEAGG